MERMRVKQLCGGQKWGWSSVRGHDLVSVLAFSLFPGPGDLESYDTCQRFSIDCLGHFT